MPSQVPIRCWQNNWLGFFFFFIKNRSDHTHGKHNWISLSYRWALCKRCCYKEQVFGDVIFFQALSSSGGGACIPVTTATHITHVSFCAATHLQLTVQFLVPNADLGLTELSLALWCLSQQNRGRSKKWLLSRGFGPCVQEWQRPQDQNVQFKALSSPLHQSGENGRESTVTRR